MNLISKLFNASQPKKDCPRCLGKGHVDWDDIKRLNNELKWIPGPCAYCNGVGKINPEMEHNIDVGATYLTTDLSMQERKRFMERDPDTLLRAKFQDQQFDDFIRQICFLYFQCNLNANQITEFLMLSKAVSDEYEKEILLAYIEKVVHENKN